MNYLMNFIIVLLIVLIIVVVSFAILDRILKNDAKKNSTKIPETKSTDIIESNQEPKNELEPAPAMKIYNSELADDINAMLNDQQSDSASNRLQLENHLHKTSNISKYIKSKNYQHFDFVPEENSTEDAETDKSLLVTRDDYKRIIALSHIDDDKPL